MITDFRIAGWAIVILCCVVVVARVASAPGPTPKRAATPAERVELAQAIATHEREWANESAKGFPEDNWSQRDDFHGREFRKVTELVKQKGVRIEDILGAVDDEIHARAVTSPSAYDARHARAVPCKPRPFYD